MNRTMDAAFLNGIANLEAVRPVVSGLCRTEGPIDLQPVLANAANVALQGEHGGFVFHKIDVALYELHTLFKPGGRGRHVREAAAFAARFMFTETDCCEIKTKLPLSNPAADLMVRLCGFRPLYERPHAWSDGSDVRFFGLTLEEWTEKDAVALEAGRGFHRVLEEAKDAVASVLDVHGHDEAHERAVGASMLMIAGGQVHKGVRAYNRWAAIAGYRQITLLSDAPIVVDVVDAVLGYRNSQLEVLKCR